MEILALLLLGLIAMLAIVPPIIRGKLEASPLTTSQDFQRSMQEMASSIEPLGRQEGNPNQDTGHVAGAGASTTALQGRPQRVPARPLRHSKAAVRRSRIITALAVFASIWGVATLISGTSWCLVVFATVSCLLVIYWAMAMLVPYLSSPVHHPRRIEKPSSPPESQAM